MTLSKPEPRTRTKARQKRQQAAARAVCRQVVYDRAEGCCEACGRPLVLKPFEARSAFEVANIDEIVSRAHGGDPTDPANCRCLCVRCHFSGPSGAHRSKDFRVVREII